MIIERTDRISLPLTRSQTRPSDAKSKRWMVSNTTQSQVLEWKTHKINRNAMLTENKVQRRANTKMVTDNRRGVTGEVTRGDETLKETDRSVAKFKVKQQPKKHLACDAESNRLSDAKSKRWRWMISNTTQSQMLEWGINSKWEGAYRQQNEAETAATTDSDRQLQGSDEGRQNTKSERVSTDIQGQTSTRKAPCL